MCDAHSFKAKQLPSTSAVPSMTMDKNHGKTTSQYQSVHSTTTTYKPDRVVSPTTWLGPPWAAAVAAADAFEEALGSTGGARACKNDTSMAWGCTPSPTTRAQWLMGCGQGANRLGAKDHIDLQSSPPVFCISSEAICWE
jgi:hypothetical protein